MRAKGGACDRLRGVRGAENIHLLRAEVGGQARGMVTRRQRVGARPRCWSAPSRVAIARQPVESLSGDICRPTIASSITRYRRVGEDSSCSGGEGHDMHHVAWPTIAQSRGVMGGLLAYVRRAHSGHAHSACRPYLGPVGDSIAIGAPACAPRRGARARGTLAADASTPFAMASLPLGRADRPAGRAVRVADLVQPCSSDAMEGDNMSGQGAHGRGETASARTDRAGIASVTGSRRTHGI